jgi:hypothetical protein
MHTAFKQHTEYWEAEGKGITVIERTKITERDMCIHI